MRAEGSSTSEDFAAQINDLVNQLTGSRKEALSDMLAVQTGAQILLQHEEQRLAKKLGSDHPRVLELQSRRLAQLENIQDLSADREIAAIRVPSIKEKEALIHGRLVDEEGRGIAGLRVYLVDESGKAVADIETETDASGYYALRLDPARLPSGKAATLTFANAKKLVVKRLDKPLTIQAGVQSISAVQMNRLELAGIQRPAPKSEPKINEGETKSSGGK